MKLDRALPGLLDSAGSFTSFADPITISECGYWYVVYADTCLGSLANLRMPIMPQVYWRTNEANVSRFVSRSIESQCGDYRAPLLRWMQSERLLDPDFAQFIIQELI